MTLEDLAFQSAALQFLVDTFEKLPLIDIENYMAVQPKVPRMNQMLSNLNNNKVNILNGTL